MEETIRGYVWALTVPCPTTGYPTPLLPNHWLARTTQQKVAIKLHPDSETGEISIELIDNATAAEGRSVHIQARCRHQCLHWRHLRRQVHRSRSPCRTNVDMFLRAIAYRPANGRGTQFRVPVDEDFEALEEG